MCSKETNAVLLLPLLKQFIFPFVHFNKRDKEMRKKEHCAQETWLIVHNLHSPGDKRLHRVANVPVERNDLLWRLLIDYFPLTSLQHQSLIRDCIIRAWL